MKTEWRQLPLTVKGVESQGQLHSTFCSYSHLHRALLYPQVSDWKQLSFLGFVLQVYNLQISITIKHVKSSFSVLITCKILNLKHIRNMISFVPEYHFLLVQRLWLLVSIYLHQELWDLTLTQSLLDKGINSNRSTCLRLDFGWFQEKVTAALFFVIHGY